MGGFPGLFELFARFARVKMPRMYRYMASRFTTLPGLYNREDKLKRWLSDGFDGLSIGRNSHFNTELLSDEQLEELGGIEYRALRALSYIVIVVRLSIHFLFVAAYPSS
jgi:hypothetical protein